MYMYIVVGNDVGCGVICTAVTKIAAFTKIFNMVNYHIMS